MQISILKSEGNLDNFKNILSEEMEHTSELLMHRFYSLCKSDLVQEITALEIYRNIDSGNAVEMYRNGTLSIGFIGLWDSVSILYNVNIETTDNFNRLFSKAYEIVEFMSCFVKKKRTETGVNFSLLASAAEGVTGRFAEYDKEHWNNKACIKDFYTNSFHIPVDKDIYFMYKIELEAPFHKLCDGGCITYVEFAEIPGENVEAVIEAIRYAHDND